MKQVFNYNKKISTFGRTYMKDDGNSNEKQNSIESKSAIPNLCTREPIRDIYMKIILVTTEILID